MVHQLASYIANGIVTNYIVQIISMYIQYKYIYRAIIRTRRYDIVIEGIPFDVEHWTFVPRHSTRVEVQTTSLQK